MRDHITPCFVCAWGVLLITAFIWPHCLSIYPYSLPIIINNNYCDSCTSLLKMEAVEWPFSDNECSNGNTLSRGNGSFARHSIGDYLSQKKFCLVINLPLRQHRTTPAITKGYITRRMAVEYSVPLITDVKCAKLLIKVCNKLSYPCILYYL